MLVKNSAARVFATTVLLVLAQQATAQAWPESNRSQQNAENQPPPIAWPELREDTTQTWVGIRHNNTDGTVVGLGVRTAAYPSMLLELEVVPPGYGPAGEDEKLTAPSLPADKLQLPTTHKLSLRYRF
jgi:hypothetical protein